MTPEGRIKQLVREYLAPYTAEADIWMPVPGGFGESRLDFCICYRGRYIAIEAKAPGKKITDRQEVNIARLTRAGAKVFVVSSEEDARAVGEYFKQLTTCCSVHGGCNL